MTVIEVRKRKGAESVIYLYLIVITYSPPTLNPTGRREVPNLSDRGLPLTRAKPGCTMVDIVSLDVFSKVA